MSEGSTARPTAPHTSARAASADAHEAVSRAAMLVARAQMLMRESMAMNAALYVPRAEGSDLAAANSRFKTAVSTYAAALRREGEPPERVLVLVKATVHTGARAMTARDAERRVLGDAVRWAVDAYYGAA